MLRVALTGGIATGKSWVRRRFEHHGIPTIDADGVARDVVAAGSPVSARIAKRFGPGVFQTDGTLDRSALAGLVFSDEQARRDLEAIVHPAVYAAIERWFADLPPSTRVAVADIPLLYETGREGGFDRVVVTACEPAEQLRRLMDRDGLSEAAARQRLSAQWPAAEKARRGTDVIRTDGTHAETDAQVDALVARLSV
jgi:dephospho-CoA kinase